MGCDSKKTAQNAFSGSFNPRTHMGCDRLRVGKRAETIGFNPRTHMGCDVCLKQTHQKIMSFNPRTHMGCDSQVVGTALIWVVFQSTHPHGVRHYSCNKGTCMCVFQSTHPHGVRHDARYRVVIGWVVSIHAPTWGATESLREPVERLQGFNPRTHMGCDSTPTITLPTSSMFQSTHPHGVRPLAFSNRWLR